MEAKVALFMSNNRNQLPLFLSCINNKVFYQSKSTVSILLLFSGETKNLSNSKKWPILKLLSYSSRKNIASLNFQKAERDRVHTLF